MVRLRLLKPVRTYALVTILRSTPYRSATNGIAEREIRNVLEGTRTLLEHSGLPTSYVLALCQPLLCGTTGGVSEASPTSVKARVENMEKSVGLSRRTYTPMTRPKPEDVLPGDPKWERIGDRVIRRYKGIN